MPTKRLDLYNVIRIKKSHMRRRMYRMAKILEREWKNMASADLNTTSVTYRNSIVVEDVSSSSLILNLRGTVANMIEQGLGPGGVGSFGPFDVRRFVLTSGNRHIKTSKGGGTYINIPFGITTQQMKDLQYNIRGVNARAAAKTLSGVMSVGSSATGYQVFNPATGQYGFPQGTMRVGAPISGKKRAALDAASPTGNAFGRLGSGFAPRMRSAPNFLLDPLSGNISVQEPHKTDPLAGMVRFEKQYSSTGKAQSMYGTWRRMSSASKPWIHPGIKPRNFAEKLDMKNAMADAFSDIV